MSAADMNLGVSDLGAGYEKGADEGLAQLRSSRGFPSSKDIQDANFRMFQAPDDGGLVLAAVVTLDAPATSPMLTQLTDVFKKGFADKLAGAGLQGYQAPQVGDETTASGIALSDLGVSAYFLGFRKANVIGIVGVVGRADFATAARLEALSMRLAAKVP